ncbi:MAG: hypothetical protein LBQ06_05165 [Frankiaceae bacterium]|jgi:hypothetical protein|nr:hypothetical protein [Frankiaceae bacterium]
MRARAAASAAPLAIGLLIGIGACSAHIDDTGGPTLTVSAPTSTGGPSGSASVELSGSPGPAGSPIAGGCGGILPVSAIDQVIGTQLRGSTSFIVGEPDPSIDRISYLNCQYAIPDPVAGQPPPTAQIEVGLSAYGSSASAQARVQGTIEAYREQGSTSTPVAVGQLSGTELLGGGDPTLVVASGNKTVAVTVAAALVTDASRDAILSGLAQRALTGLGG